MQKIFTIALLSLISVSLFYSCAKYQDPKATTDPRLVKHYCNDPLGVNYNWDFPGIPDNSVCFYPTDVFDGRYMFYDSMYLKAGYTFIGADSFVITIHKVTSTKMSVFGFCSNGDSILMTASPYFLATVDTTIGDTLTINGQRLCGMQDTINGTISQDRIDSILTINFQVAADTGVTTFHTGSATLIR